MSLLTDAMEPCVLLDKQRVPDGRGGTNTIWVEGAEFQAAITYDTSVQAKVAQAQGVKDLIKVTTTKAMNLDYHDVFRRKSDNQTFRVTSRGVNNKTPSSAGLDMRQVDAEEWTPTGD